MYIMLNKIINEDFSYVLHDENINWKTFSGKTVLVSGASGFLPFYIVGTLLSLNQSNILSKPVKVIGLVRNIDKAKIKFRNYLDDGNLVIKKIDISCPFDIDEKIDFIVHAASQASPKYFFSDPVGTIKANTLGTINLLELAKKNKVESFLYFSSGEANGDIFDKKIKITEHNYGIVDPLNVRNCYAESKKCGENLCVSYYHQYNVPVKIVRPSHTYGPGVSLTDGRVFASFVSDIINNKDIILTSDGSACRCFLYIADATRGYFTVLLKGTNANAYNVSYDKEISILNLAKILISISNNPNISIKLNKNEINNPSSKNQHALMDNSKLKKLGWFPNYSEEEGFKRVLMSFEI